MDAQTKRDKINLITDRKIYFQDPSIKRAFESEYNVKAIDFLIETETKCEIRLIGLAFPNWQNETPVNKYEVTLRNKRSNYTFDFYSSIKDTENKRSLPLDFYSVLACLSSYYPESFDEFLADFGYEIKSERDYLRIKKIHLDCIDEMRALERLFTDEQLEKLAEIN